MGFLTPTLQAGSVTIVFPDWQVRLVCPPPCIDSYSLKWPKLSTMVHEEAPLHFSLSFKTFRACCLAIKKPMLVTTPIPGDPFSLCVWP